MESIKSQRLQKFHADSLLDNTLPGTEEGCLDLRWQLQLAGYVYDQWTLQGSQEANLAERYFDGSMESLDRLLRNGSSGRKDVVQPHSFPQVSVPRRHVDELTYESFVMEYMIPNLPVIIQGTNTGWLAEREWVCSDGSVDIGFLKSAFGKATVTCTEMTRGGGYGGGKRHEMPLADFAEKWSLNSQDAALYLKDWHFGSDFPSYKAYSCPIYFQEDWLNSYFDLLCQQSAADKPLSEDGVIDSDYRFVYLGRKGTSTPIHADVLRSFSWSTNIAGRKRWLLLPPQYTPLLFDKFGRELASSFDLLKQAPELREKFPNLSKAAELAVEVHQGINEALFVPSGWHHSVENIEDTLSINHNWINGYNIHWAWQHIQEEHQAATKAIEDCRELTSPAEFEDLVQRNMAINCGMNFYSMAHFMGSIAAQQAVILQSKVHDSPRVMAALFTVQRALLVLKNLRKELDKFCSPSSAKTDVESVEELENDIEETLDELLRGLVGGKARALQFRGLCKLILILESLLREH